MSLTRAEKLKKRSRPFFEPPMAVIGSKPPEAIIKIRNFGRRVRPKLHLAHAWAVSLTRAEKLKKRSRPFFEPPMAVIGSKPPEAKSP